MLVGLTSVQKKLLPEGIIGIRRTENIEEMAILYSGAEAFINPTYIDNFPTVNIEALACGTPVITYNTGGSPEAIDDKTGFIVEKGDINQLLAVIKKILINGKKEYEIFCRNKAIDNFSIEAMGSNYLKLYTEIINKLCVWEF